MPSTKATSIRPIEQHSGKQWTEWTTRLDSLGARTKTHPQIVVEIKSLIDAGWWDKSAQPNTDWWAQNIAIAYEQHTGLRNVGQQSDGLYAATISKTVVGSVDDLLRKWSESSISEAHSKPRISKTPKRSYWRIDMQDGTKTEVAFEPKLNSKVLITISQSKITNQHFVDARKKAWRPILNSFVDGLNK